MEPRSSFAIRSYARHSTKRRRASSDERRMQRWPRRSRQTPTAPSGIGQPRPSARMRQSFRGSTRPPSAPAVGPVHPRADPDSGRRGGAGGGGVGAFERAARLTAAEASQGAYLIRAAHVALSLGRPHVVLRLLREAEPLDLEPADRTWLLWHLEQFEPRWTGATK